MNKRTKAKPIKPTLADASLSLAELRTQGDLLQRRAVQTTRQLDAAYAQLLGTDQRPAAPAAEPNDRLPPGSPVPSAMSALLDALQMQYDGCNELVAISRDIALKACDFALIRPGTESYEATQAELDALLDARSAMWEEQVKMQAIITPMLAKHGFPLQGAAPPAAASTPAATHATG